jgi:hypothetical protein
LGEGSRLYIGDERWESWSDAIRVTITLSAFVRSTDSLKLRGWQYLSTIRFRQRKERELTHEVAEWRGESHRCDDGVHTIIQFFRGGAFLIFMMLVVNL